MRRYVIGITGEKGKGKTSFVHVISYLLSINGYAVTILHFADAIKKVAKDCFGRDIGTIHGKLSQKDRELLCKIGDALRSIDKDCLVKIVERKIKQSRGFIVVGDVRLQREAQMIQKYGGVLVKIQSEIYNRRENYLTDHLTETELHKIKAPYVINNDGTFSDLLPAAKQVLSHFIKHRRWKS